MLGKLARETTINGIVDWVKERRGHRRIANGLAKRGCHVTGLDVAPAFLEQARHNAAASEVKVEYVEGDMRLLPWTEHFDCIINWFTAYGYLPDDDNRKVLSEACRALKLGGKLLIELNNRERILKNYQHETIVERDGNYMLDRMHYDVLMGRNYVERLIIRDGQVRQMHFLFASSPILNSPYGFSRQVFGRSMAMIKMVRPST